jgi:archaellum component FlaC
VVSKQTEELELTRVAGKEQELEKLQQSLDYLESRKKDLEEKYEQLSRRRNDLRFRQRHLEDERAVIEHKLSRFKK